MPGDQIASASYDLENQAEDINTIGSFLASRDVPELKAESVNADFVILAGNALPCTGEMAAEAILSGVAPQLIITGGIGHSTAPLYTAVGKSPKLANLEVKSGLTEAEVFEKICTHVCHIKSERIILEKESTNCGENARKTLALLAGMGRDKVKVVLMQDPTMQRRTVATFKKELESRADANVEILSYAPCVPVVEVRADKQGFQFTRDVRALEPIWPVEYYISIIMGEILRLQDNEQGYGPLGRGYIVHVEIPPKVMEAFTRLTTVFQPRGL